MSIEKFSHEQQFTSKRNFLKGVAAAVAAPFVPLSRKMGKGLDFLGSFHSEAYNLQEQIEIRPIEEDLREMLDIEMTNYVTSDGYLDFNSMRAEVNAIAGYEVVKIGYDEQINGYYFDGTGDKRVRLNFASCVTNNIRELKPKGGQYAATRVQVREVNSTREQIESGEAYKECTAGIVCLGAVDILGTDLPKWTDPEIVVDYSGNVTLDAQGLDAGIIVLGEQSNKLTTIRGVNIQNTNQYAEEGRAEFGAVMLSDCHFKISECWLFGGDQPIPTEVLQHGIFSRLSRGIVGVASGSDAYLADLRGNTIDGYGWDSVTVDGSISPTIFRNDLITYAQALNTHGASSNIGIVFNPFLPVTIEQNYMRGAKAPLVIYDPQIGSNIPNGNVIETGNTLELSKYQMIVIYQNWKAEGNTSIIDPYDNNLPKNNEATNYPIVFDENSDHTQWTKSRGLIQVHYSSDANIWIDNHTFHLSPGIEENFNSGEKFVLFNIKYRTPSFGTQWESAQDVWMDKAIIGNIYVHDEQKQSNVSFDHEKIESLLARIAPRSAESAYHSIYILFDPETQKIGAGLIITTDSLVHKEIAWEK